MNELAKKDLHDGIPALLTIDNMANGGVYELMGDALSKMAANIMDPNTSEKQKRKVTLTIEASPYPDRSGFTFSAKVDTKLAGISPLDGTAYIARKNGEYLVVGKNHKQMEMELGLADEPEGQQKPV